MHVAVFGAGALGSVYGVRLAKRTTTEVSFIVRPARVSETHPIAIESAWNGKREVMSAPVRVATAPPDADVVLLTVGADDLDALGAPLATTSAPIVVVTPMMPQDWDRMQKAYGDRVFAAYPTMSSYLRKADGVIRYWVLPAPMLIDEPRGRKKDAPAIHELVTQLTKAGLRAALELGVHESESGDDGQVRSRSAWASASRAAPMRPRRGRGPPASSSAARAAKAERLAHRIGTPAAAYARPSVRSWPRAGRSGSRSA